MESIIQKIKGSAVKENTDLNAVLDQKPHITMDDGADLVSTIHSKRKDLVKNIKGGTEETTLTMVARAQLAGARREAGSRSPTLTMRVPGRSTMCEA